jgi:hypothetical protein
MANRNSTPSPVLSLPPLEYDAQYFNNMVRLLNYFITQQDNPGNMRGSKLEISDGGPDVAFLVDSKASDADILKFVIRKLPTSATGLEQGQVWNDAGTLKIVL